MKPNSLRIFKKKNGINLTPDQLGALVLTILLLLLVFLEKPLGYSFDGWVTFVSILWFLYLIVLLVSSFFRYEPEFGNYTGYLTLCQEKIQVDKEDIELTNIEKLEFVHAYDIRGRFKNPILRIKPRLSNELDNLVEITLKNGNKIKENFLQTESDRLMNFKALLILYHQNGIISWLHLLDLLEITDYSEIQEFKKEVNNYGQQRI